MNDLYPQARGIVVRHPVTNIASILKRSAPLADAKLARHTRVGVVRYEDLVEAPGETMEYVAKAVGGRDFDPSLRLVSYTKESYSGKSHRSVA